MFPGDFQKIRGEYPIELAHPLAGSGCLGIRSRRLQPIDQGRSGYRPSLHGDRGAHLRPFGGLPNHGDVDLERVARLHEVLKLPVHHRLQGGQRGEVRRLPQEEASRLVTAAKAAAC